MFENTIKLLTQLRKTKPLILNITNVVTMDFVANGLLSLGASPIMSDAKEESEELVKISNAIVINPGTLSEHYLELAHEVCRFANKYQKPIILDPVGAGASDYRTKNCQKLLKDYKIDIVRGNGGEIMALLGDEHKQTKGVDSLAGSDVALESAKKLAKLYPSTVFVISGKTDWVVSENKFTSFERGSAMMPLITGSGCLLTSVIAAFHASFHDAFEASSMAALFYSICGEVAEEKSKGPGSFRTRFIDTLFQMPEKHWYE
jgi:hydroxyethylthiazole kinase